MLDTKNELLDDFEVASKNLKELDFPLTFEFKIGTMANDFNAKDSNNKTVAYVR